MVSSLYRRPDPAAQLSKKSGPVHQSMFVFQRDGFIDRYDGARLVLPGALRLISQLLSDHFLWHTHGKLSESHIVHWELYPTIDHVVPVTRGGDDDESILGHDLHAEEPSKGASDAGGTRLGAQDRRQSRRLGRDHRVVPGPCRAETWCSVQFAHQEVVQRGSTGQGGAVVTPHLGPTERRSNDRFVSTCAAIGRKSGSVSSVFR